MYILIPLTHLIQNSFTLNIYLDETNSRNLTHVICVMFRELVETTALKKDKPVHQVIVLIPIL